MHFAGKTYTQSAQRARNIFFKFKLYYIYKDPVSIPHIIRSVNVLNTSRLMMHKKTINICRKDRWDYRECLDNIQMF